MKVSSEDVVLAKQSMGGFSRTDLVSVEGKEFTVQHFGLDGRVLEVKYKKDKGGNASPVSLEYISP